MLVVHNRYRLRGGEDAVFEAETALLERAGHAVRTLVLHNDEVDEGGKLALAAGAVWNRDGRARVERAAREHRAEVVHFHNTLPLVSPAGYYGARAAGAAVVQTLHNYRLVCPGALLFRDGGPCERCVGKAFAASGVRHGCYRESPAATLAVATMTTAHRALGTWQRAVDRYITLTHFARGKFIQGGLPADRLVVKPNPLAHDPGEGRGEGGFALYVGRLDRGKGVETMAEAWRRDASLPPLVIVGDGPLAWVAESLAAEQPDRVQWLGWRDHDEVLAHMQDAGGLVFPSEVYEGAPMGIIEAQACGLPVVASRRGAMETMVIHGETGYHFTPGDPTDLAIAVHRLFGTDSTPLRRNARTAFTSTYAPDVNLRHLVAVYHEALAVRAA